MCNGNCEKYVFGNLNIEECDIHAKNRINQDLSKIKYIKDADKKEYIKLLKGLKRKMNKQVDPDKVVEFIKSSIKKLSGSIKNHIRSSYKCDSKYMLYPLLIGLPAALGCAHICAYVYDFKLGRCRPMKEGDDPRDVVYTCFAEREFNMECKREAWSGSDNFRKPYLDISRLIIPFLCTRFRRVYNLGTKGDFGGLWYSDYQLKVLWEIAKATPWNVYLLSTRNIQRMKDFIDENGCPDNIWIAVSIRTRDEMKYLKILKSIKCKHKYVNFAPLLDLIPTRNFEFLDFATIAYMDNPCKRVETSREFVNDAIIKLSEFDLPILLRNCKVEGQKQGQWLKGRRYDFLLETVIKDRFLKSEKEHTEFKKNFSRLAIKV